ncbi:MAG: amidase [Planctomycetota bacterium]|nr:MAG: amidase [Planctomycetota bacterium]
MLWPLFLAVVLVVSQGAGSPSPAPLDVADLEAAGRLSGLAFTPSELELMLPGVIADLASYERLRALPVPHALPPALAFSPLLAGVSADPWLPPERQLRLPDVRRPDELSELLFADIPTLAALLRSRQVSCEELLELHLTRLRALDETLHCVISYTEERARAQARSLDAELAAGRWRGPLHGIPWGAKDLLAVRGAPTTWGAQPFAEQVIDADAEVVARLDAAGAVLIAKLSLGALAWGDVWFGGKTRNPWNAEQGSSGSSAGPAAATAAGGVVFAIGSETHGSIVSPSERCGTTGLRPSFGRVPRTGAMTLCWSMDKLGPLTRSVGDAALVFDAIVGPDGDDLSVLDLPWRLPLDVDVSGWKVGYAPSDFEQRAEHAAVLDELRALGVELVPIELPDAPIEALMIGLSVEAATAFDELTRSGRDDLLVRQIARAWPNVFRVARLVPAVEFLRAQRLRTQLVRDLERCLGEVVAWVHPSFAGPSLGMTNLTGHPAVVMPCGVREDGTPFGISFGGRLYDEARLLALAEAWQRSTTHHRGQPMR